MAEVTEPADAVQPAVVQPVVQPVMPGGESTSAQLRNVRQERDELKVELAETFRKAGHAAARFNTVRAERNEAMSMLAQIGDALSPTGERPEEALGTLVGDIEALVEQRYELAAGVDSLKTAFVLAGGSRNFNRNRALKAEAELESARAELEQRRAANAELAAEVGDLRELVGRLSAEKRDLLVELERHAATAVTHPTEGGTNA